jgi:hypothetical protein
VTEPSLQERLQHSRRKDYCAPAADGKDLDIVRLLGKQIGRLLDSPAPTGARCLDIGCGRQPFRLLLEAHGYEYHGLDVANNPEGTVDYIGQIESSIPEACLARSPYDLLLCSEVLEHVYDCRAAMQNISLLAAANARIIVTCPFMYPLHEEPYDYWRGTKYAWKKCAEDVGLVIEEQLAAGNAYHVLRTSLAEIACPRQTDFWGWLLSVPFRAWRRMSLAALRNPIFENFLVLHSRFYLSNVLVLRKPR